MVRKPTGCCGQLQGCPCGSRPKGILTRAPRPPFPWVISRGWDSPLPSTPAGRLDPRGPSLSPHCARGSPAARPTRQPPRPPELQISGRRDWGLRFFLPRGPWFACARTRQAPQGGQGLLSLFCSSPILENRSPPSFHLETQGPPVTRSRPRPTRRCPLSPLVQSSSWEISPLY